MQIDALGRGSPPPGQNVDKKFRTTGAIYNIANQTLDESVVANGAGQWNKYEILVTDNRFTVFLNGQQKTDFVNADLTRGKADAGSRFIGLQTHTGRVLFRNIQNSGAAVKLWDERNRGSASSTRRAYRGEARSIRCARSSSHNGVPAHHLRGIGDGDRRAGQGTGEGGIETAVLLFGPTGGGAGQLR